MSRQKKKNKPLLFEEILNVLNSRPGQAWNYRQLSAALGVHDKNDRQALLALLEDFVRRGLVEETDRGKYRAKSVEKIISGTVDMTQSGAAFISSPEASADIYIAPRYINGALHGDSVRVKLFSRKRGGGREEGEIIEVIQRGKKEFAGTLQVQPRVAFFVPDNRKFPDFIIPKEKMNGAKDGQKVVVQMTEWKDVSDLPQGEVVSVLGNAGENDTEINAIMVEYGLPWKFPPGVEKIAGHVPTEITQEEIGRRRDMRDATTFTIDPSDAKDFDDALSVRKTTKGTWEVGVHIADVTHYVKPESVLDKEALVRGTSVYLVDRVVPMLPEVLSNFVCSLRPNEEKLTFSAVFEMDEHAQIISEWFGKTIIKSNRRFAYEEVQEILEGKSGDYKEEIHLLDRLAKKLRADRLKKGSITFEREEVKFHLDENGNPTGVYFKVMKDSNQLIEDFMLLANRRVAEYVALKHKAGDNAKKNQSDLRRPFVYRIHNAPAPERVAEFSTFVRTFGYKMNTGSERAIAESLNHLLKDVQGKPEANMIETLAIRTMAKAIYSTDNIGHYGLGFAYYTHFTSPIRRYPDMMVHRLLEHYIAVDAGKKEPVPDQNFLEQECKHCSEREKLAAEAERASIKYKQVQFLQDKVGKSFPGIISGVMEYGLFVELKDNKCEGMVHVRNLTDDRYVFEQEFYRLRGLRSGKTFSLGDEVQVIIKSADLVKKQIDFVPDTGRGHNDADFFPGRDRGKQSKGRKTFSETSGKDDFDKLLRGKKNDRKKRRR